MWCALKSDPLIVRTASSDDLHAISTIQAASPEASQWEVQDYLAYQCLVAVYRNRVVGFIVARELSDKEREILNLAVDPNYRRRGVGARLVRELLSRHCSSTFLEVRGSNSAAQKLYQTVGFQEFSRRKEYYQNPPEHGIVMKLGSC